MDIVLTGATIAKLRKAAGLTQVSLADKLGISDKAVSKWERGISLPDAVYWNKLAVLLDTDIESLIYGHEQAEDWIGVLILEESVAASTTIYNKPLIDYLLSQFLLVGIREIVIVGECDEIRIPGVKVTVKREVNQRFTKNAFVIYGHQFLYGPNLTKHFKRAMSRDGITVVAAMKAKGKYGLAVDSNRHAKLSDEYNMNKYYALPYAFIPKNSNFEKFEKVLSKEVCVETLVRGMVHFNLSTYESTYQMAGFVKMMEENTGERIADIDEIVKRRIML
jgi:transcriptional regulator with XRE-family HTH domain